jgi:hypothetical protein
VGKEGAIGFGFGALGLPFGIVQEGRPFRFATGHSARQRQGALGAGGVDEDEAASVGGLELVVGIEELDALDGAVGGEVDADLVGDTDGLHRLGLLAQSDIGDVVLRVVGKAHGLPPLIPPTASPLFAPRSTTIHHPKGKDGAGRRAFPHSSLSNQNWYDDAHNECL